MSLSSNGIWPAVFFAVFSMFTVLGHRRRAHRRAADVEDGSQIHGQVVHRDFFPRDDRQTRRIWLQEVFHRRLVLA